MTTTTVYDGTAAGQPYVSVTQTDRDAQMVVTAMLSRLTGKWHLSGRLTYPNGDHRDLYIDGEFRGDRDDAEREALLAAADQTRWHDTGSITS